MTPGSPFPSAAAADKLGRITILLFTLSFFLHLALVLAVRHYQHPILWENGEIAGNLFKGEGFRIDHPGHIAEPTSWQAPGYPVLLCIAWKLFGQTPAAYLMVSVIQCLAVASMVWPMGFLSRRWFPNTPPWIVQAFVIVYPLYLWYATRLHHTVLVMAVHPWLIWAWIECARRGPCQAIGTGVLTGIAGLFQPVLLGPYAICGAVLLGHSVLKGQWTVSRRLILAAAAVVACLAPWTIRNYKVHGRLILVKSSMGHELWLGNNPHSTGTGYVEGGTNDISNVYPPKAYALLGKVPEIVTMDAQKAEAWDYMKTHPARTLEMTLRKIVWFWTVAPSNLVRSTGGGEALRFRAIDMGYWVLVVGLALVGLFSASSPVREYILVLALFVVFYSGIYGITHVGQVRFRGEIEFIFLFASAAGLHFLLRLVAARRKPETSAL